jgi:hypothetical protein
MTVVGAEYLNLSFPNFQRYGSRCQAALRADFPINANTDLKMHDVNLSQKRVLL